MCERDCSLQYLANSCELLLVSCKHWARELAVLTYTMFNKKLRVCYCPHGNSDKGSLNPSSDLLINQDLSLVYGNHMKDMLSSRGVLQSLQGVITTGNYRHAYYLQHQKFYDDLVEKDIFSKCPEAKKIILYAPTWQDPENSTSFFEACDPIIQQLPDDHFLIVKLHPNLENEDPAKVYRLLGKYEHIKNVLFLIQYPLVYPILNRVDIYLGDFSSIGYDFLCFNRPMFFFHPTTRKRNADLGLFLFQCGVEIPPQAYSNIYAFIEKSILDKEEELKKKREEIYSYTFEKNISLKQMKEDLTQLVKNTSSLNSLFKKKNFV